MICDYHVHTEFSDDSEYEMEQVVIDAIQKGITDLCFTDHVDYGIKRDWDDAKGMIYRKGGFGEPDRIPLANVDYPRYVERIKALRKKYEGQIKIGLGLEFGMQQQTIDQFQKLYDRFPFDFIILSLHQIDNKEFWTKEFQRGRTQKEFYIRYYEEMLSLVTQYHDYSVLGHMDLIVRYDDAPEPLAFSEVKCLIEAILKKVIEDGKGIEVNTSSTRYGLELTPSREILELYKELGGRIITIGSDSHKPEHLGYNISETVDLLKKIGFDEICTYKRMQPLYHKI
ncbi:MAG: histidinol-phosphatase HisJ family protein [Eubacteriales bacterium]|nr:histidinol-phosphatase HisJ family protein [Eubacteriales bacterium]